MSDYAKNYINYLVALRERDTGAMARLRHSLAFEPGTYPNAYPYVERFVGEDWHGQDARRLALYAIAGLFARHPVVIDKQSFAKAFAKVANERGSESIEKRFIALLDSDSETIFDYLRHAISLLAADGVGFDYTQLLSDLTYWMNRHSDLSRLRQSWARDFYGVWRTRV